MIKKYYREVKEGREQDLRRTEEKYRYDWIENLKSAFDVRNSRRKKRSCAVENTEFERNIQRRPPCINPQFVLKHSPVKARKSRGDGYNRVTKTCICGTKDFPIAFNWKPHPAEYQCLGNCLKHSKRPSDHDDDGIWFCSLGCWYTFHQALFDPRFPPSK